MIRFIHKHLTVLLVGASCAAAGAGAGAIATAGAATPSHSSKSTRRAELRRLIRHTVAGSLVVHTKQGFVTVTVARGTVRSVSGQQLTLAEGTRKAVYRTVTLTLPTNTRVRDNRQKATLNQVQSGQRAVILVAPHRPLVVAHTPK